MTKALSSEDARKPGAHVAPGADVSRAPLVLVAENHQDTRFMLRTMLERSVGVSVVEAEDGEVAASLAESLNPDLIVMDGALPLLDGFAVTRRIRGLTNGRDVPIVLLSGQAQPVFQTKAFAAGCTDYFVKPFALSELVRVLERHLAQRAKG